MVVGSGAVKVGRKGGGHGSAFCSWEPLGNVVVV